MSTKTLGIIVIVVGVVVLVISLIADAIGIGGAPGIGWKQILGAGVGVVAALIGVGLMLNRTKRSK